MTETTLREITRETLGELLRLEVREDQRRFVANNAVSIAQAHFTPTAWFRGIYADDTPVGFVMLDLCSEDEGQVWVWRLMIDQHHQRRGHGRRAMQQVIDHVRALGTNDALYVSYVPGDGNPSPLYLGLGFQDTGREEHGERILRLPL